MVFSYRKNDTYSFWLQVLTSNSSPFFTLQILLESLSFFRSTKLQIISWFKLPVPTSIYVYDYYNKRNALYLSIHPKLQ